MLIHAKFHYRVNANGDVLFDWVTVGELFQYNGLELIVDSIDINFIDFTADIRAHDDNTKQSYILTQRDIHSFLEKL